MQTYCLQVPQLLPEVLVRDLFKSFSTLNDSLVGNSNEEVDPKAGQKAKTGKANIKLTCQRARLQSCGSLCGSAGRYQHFGGCGASIPAEVTCDTWYHKSLKYDL
jgi:hypothetical protein